jgi:Viral BACON domain
MKNRFGALLMAIASCLALAACGGGSGGGGTQNSNPVVALSATSAFFGANLGLAFNATPENVTVSNSGTGTLNFTAASDSPWLMVTPASGSAPSQIAITTTLGTLAVGTYTGHVTVTATGSQGAPATVTVTFVVANQPTNTPFWAQWGANPQHTGAVNVLGQNATAQLADIVYEPFVTQEQAENAGAGRGSALTVHYPAPITDGNDVYFMTKSGTYMSCSPAGAWSNGAACGPNTWNTEIWNEVRYTWIDGAFEPVWTYASDWKPEPNGASLEGWEPVFHSVDANGFIYVPGAGGTVWKITQASGSWVTHIDPFSSMNNVVPGNTYVAGPLTADSAGNIYYNAIQLAAPSAGDPWQTDVLGAWLVKITPGDVATVLSFSSLVSTAPAGTATTCPGQFGSGNGLPWPPSNVVGTNQQPPTVLCGSQRPGINIAPAIGADGTIYTVSRAHFDSMQSYLVAVKSDFSGPKWATSMQQLLNDGCGVLVPIGPSNSTPNACRVGATMGVDPTTNAPGSAEVFDLGSSSPVVLPDGSVIFGAITAYNGFRGHMFKFSSAGAFLAAYDFGWDSTPAVYSHGGTYSIVLKDNHYGSPLYCNSSSSICASQTPGPYYVTQLDPSMNVQWQYQNTNTQSCSRNSNGTLSCSTTNPNGFEWCINMPAVDSSGNVYATSEDGNLYVLPQGNTGVFTTAKANIFLNLALDAAYTPLSIDQPGRIYTQNDGHLFVVGN